MVNLFLGPFKKVFAENQFGLACQLYSGDTYFEYTEPTDPTIKDSTNGLTAYYNASLHRLTHSVIQHNDAGSLSMVASSNIMIGKSTDEPTIDYYRIPLGVSIHSEKKFIAEAIYISSRPAGGFHIETISDVNYIVAYVITTPGTGYGVKIQRYSTLYDVDIDPSTVTNFITGTPDYEETYIGTNDTTYADKIQDGTEATITFPGRNRNISYNSDAGKICFFAKMKDDGGDYYNQWAILEATDTGTGFTIALDHIFYENPTTQTDSVSRVFNGTEVSSYTRDSGIFDVDHDSDNSGSITENNYSVAKDTFLGVTYDAYNGDLIVAYKKETTDTWENVGSSSNTTDSTLVGSNSCTYNGGTNSQSQTTTKNWRFTGRDVETSTNLVIDNGVTVVSLTGLISYHNSSGSGSSALYQDAGGSSASKDTTWTFQREDYNITDIAIIDLAAHLFAYTVTEIIINDSGTDSSSSSNDISVINYDADGTESVKTVIYANGIKTTLAESTIAANETGTISNVSSSGASQAIVWTGCEEICSTGCGGDPETATRTITTTYP